MKKNILASIGIIGLGALLAETFWGRMNHSSEQDKPEFSYEQIEQIESYIQSGNYQNAVDVYLSKKEQRHCTTMSNNCKPEHLLVRSLGLSKYLPDLEICGTENTPTCEELLVNPNCSCIVYRMEKSKDLLEHIKDIEIGESGYVYVTFDKEMKYLYDPSNPNLLIFNRLPIDMANKAYFMRD